MGDVQRLDRVDTTVVRDLVEGPWFAGAGNTDPVEGSEFDSIEGRVIMSAPRVTAASSAVNIFGRLSLVGDVQRVVRAILVLNQNCEARAAIV